MRYVKEYKIFEKEKTGERVKVFKYKVIKKEPIEALKKYKNHRRLKVFYHKGLKCVNYDKCGREGSVIVHGLDNGGSMHIDLCTADLYPMTIDHIIPKSKGGSNKLSNLDPMCSGCNSNKGNKMEDDIIMPKKPKGNKRYNIEIGDIVYKKISNEYLGEVIDIKPNFRHPHNAMSAVIKERSPESLYDLRRIYKIDKK